jgi:hypothetical protein
VIYKDRKGVLMPRLLRATALRDADVITGHAKVPSQVWRDQLRSVQVLDVIGG